MHSAFDAPRPSSHLARWGIAAQPDDGIFIARARVGGVPLLVAAQDERFLGGSVGANHGSALTRVLVHARGERPGGVLILAASGGVRLHEANPGELALARALSALLDLRASGVPVVCISVADTFGGSSVLACAAERTALIPGTRFGLSGPAVIETARGRSEVDATDAVAVAALFGAEARSARGHLELVGDDAASIRDWIVTSIAASQPLIASIHDVQQRLAARLAAAGEGTVDHASEASEIPARLAPLYANAEPVDAAGRLFRMKDRRAWLAYPDCSVPFGPREAHDLDAALLAHVAPLASSSAQTVLLVGDALGHEASRNAELLCISQYLAQHAAVIATLRNQGSRVRGLLFDTGHSAAFFSNVLQASDVYAMSDSRVVAMAPAAIARVTRLPSAEIAALVENDPVLGHPVRHFASFGGVDRILADHDPHDTLELVLGDAPGRLAPPHVAE